MLEGLVRLTFTKVISQHDFDFKPLHCIRQAVWDCLMFCSFVCLFAWAADDLTPASELSLQPHWPSVYHLSAGDKSVNVRRLLHEDQNQCKINKKPHYWHAWTSRSFLFERLLQVPVLVRLDVIIGKIMMNCCPSHDVSCHSSAFFIFNLL